MKRIKTAVKRLTALSALVAVAVAGGVLLPAPACFVPFFGVVAVFAFGMAKYNGVTPVQGTPVDKVLYHHTHGGEFAAAESWSRKGRGYTAAVLRQGMGELLDEASIDSYKPVFELGFVTGEEGKEKALDALRKQVERRDATIDRQSAELDRLQRELSQRPERPARPAKSDIYTDVLTEWGRTEKDVDEILRERGLQRIEPPTAPEPVTLEPEPMPGKPEDFQTAEEPEELTPDYKALTGDERKEAMAALKDEGMSYTQIGELFGVTSGCVKSTVSQWRKQSRVLPLNISDGLSGVCEGV